MNILMFCAFGFIYAVYQNLAVLTMYYAHLASINAGIIATLWSTTPLTISILDWLINGTKLQMQHFIGIGCLVDCAAVVAPGIVLWCRCLGANAWALHQLLPTDPIGCCHCGATSTQLQLCNWKCHGEWPLSFETCHQTGKGCCQLHQ